MVRLAKFVIEGGRSLKGTVRVSGSKNAALPILAATILADGKCVIKNVPELRDVTTMCEILARLGVVTRRREDKSIEVEVRSEKEIIAPYELVSTMRASVCVLGPLLAKRRKAQVSLPGGCVIGIRPIDLHLKGLAGLGADIRIEHGYVVANAEKLIGTEVYLGGAFGSTVTGTANLMMAATLAKGTTIIENAACEPEVQDLAMFLNKMGARISGIGTHRLTIHGVESLTGTEYEIIPDRIEAGTFMVASAMTGGDVTVEGARAEHLGALIDSLRIVGATTERLTNGIRTIGHGSIRPTDVTTLPYPGFPTDLQAQFTALLSIAEGISVITEKIYPDRFMHIAELARMGARIRKEGPSAIIHGVRKLHGAPVMASDLRASASLVLAGLVAEGTTEVQRIYHLERGYERFEEKLTSLGAKIRRTV